MAVVDPEDDSIRRFVVFHYRYDPDRSERRQVLVAAYDRRREWEADLQRRHADMDRRRAGDPTFDRRESVTGVIRQPGDLARVRAGHAARRMVEHGVWDERALDGAELPRNMAVFRAER
jgi:hypothetical protein